MEDAMPQVIAMLVVLTLPHGDVAEYRCELAEVNTVVDNEGCPRMQQVIFRDLAEVRDWRMTTKCGLPTYDYATGCYVTRWVEAGVLVEVKSAAVVYSMCEEDRELDERSWLPECKRKRINR
jgi:hypothetical protein